MHKNNFDFLRLIFALSVIITHSYPLTGLNEWEHDWLSGITNSQATFSYIGVRGFFIISGFLIYQSMIRSQNLPNYFWKRVLRLYPALIVVLILSVFFAFFVYSGDYESYKHNKSALDYLTNNLTLFKVQYSIDGVLQGNPSPAVNGSLWTIPYEFFLYVLIGALWFFRRWNLKYIVVLVFLFFLTSFFARDAKPWTFLYLDSKYIYELGVFFLGGSLLAAFEVEKYKVKRLMFFAGLVLFLLSIKTASFGVMQIFCLPMMIIPFGLWSFILLRDISSRIGDLSYGIYIYGYPVQQALVYYFKPSPIVLTLTSLPIVCLLAYMSWHLVEKRALSWKNFHLSFSFIRKKKESEDDEEDFDRILVGKGRG